MKKKKLFVVTTHLSEYRNYGILAEDTIDAVVRFTQDGVHFGGGSMGHAPVAQEVSNTKQNRARFLRPLHKKAK